MARLRTAGEDGFTLLEVLVALVIALLAFAVIYRGGAEVLQTDQAASQTVTALAHAQSRLAALCRGGSISAGTDGGDDGNGYQWSATITNRGDQIPATMNQEQTLPTDRAPPQRITWYDVEVVVTAADGRKLRLATQCVGQQAAAQDTAP